MSDEPMLTPEEESELVDLINGSYYLQPNPIEPKAWCSDEAPCSRLATLQARGDRLAGYASHDDDCAINSWMPRGDVPCPSCTCGLDQALTEWRKPC